jgi:phospholipase C
MRRLPFLELCLPLSVIALAACSSTDTSTVTRPPPTEGGSTPLEGGGACKPDPTFAARRDTCDFTSGASVKDTIGNCVKDAIPIEHIVVLMQENRSFDQYYGHLPGHGQDDVNVAKEGTTNVNPSGGTPIAWHHETSYCLEDTDHGWVASHQQYNDGKMDGFAVSNTTSGDPTGQRALGYYEESDLPFYYKLISSFATSDKYFCSLLGPTYPNRMYLYGGSSYGSVSTNLTELINNELAPPGSPNVFRSMEAAGVTWNVYRSNLPGNAVFFDTVQDTALSNHYKPIEDFATDAAAGNLPQVSFIDALYVGDPWVENDEHPPANMQLGQHFVWEQVKALTSSPLWPKSALFITYDEHGGLYDHVPPPPACAPDDIPPKLNPELGGFDRLGFRVPLIVVSPWVKPHYVSHKVHSHTSILRFIEAKFDFRAITNRDANSDALLDLFDFESDARLDVPALEEPPIDQAKLDECKAAFGPKPSDGGAPSGDGGAMP